MNKRYLIPGLVIAFASIMLAAQTNAELFLDDKDADGIFDEAESEIWGSDPNKLNTDMDRYADGIEIEHGYSPTLATPLKLDATVVDRKNRAMQSLEEDLSSREDVNTTINSKEVGLDFVSFEEEDGLFRLDHLNTISIHEYKGIYYAQGLLDKKVYFQIFQASEETQFDPLEYECHEHNALEVCYSKNPPDSLVTNLELFPRKNVQIRKNMAYLSSIGAMGYDSSIEKFSLISRGEALKMALLTRYPSKDFAVEAHNCFGDISKSHPLSGFICFAKKQGIVVGINGDFSPNNSINLFGMLKILFKVHEIEGRQFDAALLNMDQFEQMGKLHYAYPLIAKSIYEGIYANHKNLNLWPNQNIYRGEALEITKRFLDWKNGKKLHVYADIDISPLDSHVDLTPSLKRFYFKKDDKKRSDETIALKTEVRDEGDKTELFVRRVGGVNEYIHHLESNRNIQAIQSFEDDKASSMSFEVTYDNNSKTVFRSKVDEEDYEMLKEMADSQMNQKVLQKLFKMSLLPNHAARYPTPTTLPHIRVFLRESDFHDIYVHRTHDERYPAFLELEYPDGHVAKRSIVIKTRGNANKGYIKPSYTIEAYDDFEDYKDFRGDEFLDNDDEFKLRGFIDDETHLHEKLFYRSFESLGHMAPHFFEATFEINGVPMGLFQVTEPIKKDFFRERDIETKNYYYGETQNNEYNSDLDYHLNDTFTLAQYKLKGDAELLLDFIKDLHNLDPELIWQIDKQTVFDYVLLAYLSNAFDSVNNNYYVYFDDTKQQWSLFTWDGDHSFKHIPTSNRSDFLDFAKRNHGSYNQLFYYTFTQLSPVEFDYFLEQFKKKWQRKVDLLGMIKVYQDRLGPYFRYDNALWNGKSLERRKDQVDTMAAIEQLKREIEKIRIDLL